MALNISCVEKKSTETEIGISESESNLKSDTIKFTSGISAVFQDSKGNYWFGSNKEGVAVYNGKTFEKQFYKH